MASDDNPEQEQARKLIAEANKTLARLQSARLHTYAGRMPDWVQSPMASSKRTGPSALVHYRSGHNAILIWRV
jgi:hypothetical protein